MRITDFGIAIARTRPAHHALDRHARLHGARAADAGRVRFRSGPTSTRSAWSSTSCSSGRQPFDRRSSRTRRASRRGRRRSSPTSIPRLERVILQALAPDPRDRPASAAAMAATLPTLSTVGARRRLRPWLAGGGARGSGGRRLPLLSSLLLAARRARVDRPGHDRARRLREHDRRAGVRRRAQGGAGGRAGAVAVSESVSRRARARDACV